MPGTRVQIQMQQAEQAQDHDFFIQSQNFAGLMQERVKTRVSAQTSRGQRGKIQSAAHQEGGFKYTGKSNETQVTLMRAGPGSHHGGKRTTTGSMT